MKNAFFRAALLCTALGFAALVGGCSDRGTGFDDAAGKTGVAGILGTEHPAPAGDGSRVASTAEEGTRQRLCPVMGRRISPDIYTDYRGERVYFCCPPCVEDFEKAPQGYLEKMKASGVRLEKSP